MTKQQINDTIDTLSKSQGFYGRLKRDLTNASEEVREAFYSKFEHCSDPVDFIIALEG